MKNSLLLIVACFLLAPPAGAQRRGAELHGPPVSIASQQSRELAEALGKIRKLDSASFRIGFGSAPGKFHALALECLKHGTVENFKEMLADEAPLVRVMGLLCLSQSMKPGEFAALVETFRKDEARVRYTNGCVIDERATVGQLAQQIADGLFRL